MRAFLLGDLFLQLLDRFALRRQHRLKRRDARGVRLGEALACVTVVQRLRDDVRRRGHGAPKSEASVTALRRLCNGCVTAMSRL